MVHFAPNGFRVQRNLPVSASESVPAGTLILPPFKDEPPAFTNRRPGIPLLFMIPNSIQTGKLGSPDSGFFPMFSFLHAGVCFYQSHCFTLFSIYHIISLSVFTIFIVQRILIDMLTILYAGSGSFRSRPHSLHRFALITKKYYNGGNHIG